MSFKCGRENVTNNLCVGIGQIIMNVFNYTSQIHRLKVK